MADELTPEEIAAEAKLEEAKLENTETSRDKTGTVPLNDFLGVKKERNILREKIATLEKDITGIKDSQKVADEEELAKQGKFEELYKDSANSNKTLQGTIAQYQEQDKSRWERMKNLIPEDIVKHFRESDSAEDILFNIGKFEEYSDLKLIAPNAVVSSVNFNSPHAGDVNEGKFGPGKDGKYYQKESLFMEADFEGYEKWLTQAKNKNLPLGKNRGIITKTVAL